MARRVLASRPRHCQGQGTQPQEDLLHLLLRDGREIHVFIHGVLFSQGFSRVVTAHHRGGEQQLLDADRRHEGQRHADHGAHGVRHDINRVQTHRVQEGHDVIGVLLHGVHECLGLVGLAEAAGVDRVDVETVAELADRQTPDAARVGEAVDEQQGLGEWIAAFHVGHRDAGGELDALGVIVPVLMGGHGAGHIHYFTSASLRDSRSLMIWGISLSRW